MAIHKTQSIFTALAVLLLVACAPEPPENNEKTPPTQEEKTDQPIEQATDDDGLEGETTQPIFDESKRTTIISNLLQGKWRNLQDNSVTVEFVGTDKFREYKNDVLENEYDLTMDISCQSEEGANENGNKTLGRCFRTKGQCFIASRIDSKYLVFRPYGSELKASYAKVGE